MRQDAFFCKDGLFLEKRFQGLSNHLKDIKKWKTIYLELVAQFEYFKVITKGQADYKHVDFHLWYNLTWPGAIALNIFSLKYGIKTVRYWAIRPSKRLKNKLFRLVSWNPFVKSIKSCSILYFLNNSHSLTKNSTIELFCHPNYKNDTLLDDTPSYLNQERIPMQKQIKDLRRMGNNTYISWDDVSL